MSDKHQDGIRRGMKWAVEWLHTRAKDMNDPHARQVLNAAAFNMGTDAKLANVKPRDEDDLIEHQQKAIDLLLNALDNVEVNGVNNGVFVMIPSVEWDSIFRVLVAHLRAARSAKEQAERVLKGEGS